MISVKSTMNKTAHSDQLPADNTSYEAGGLC